MLSRMLGKKQGIGPELARFRGCNPAWARVLRGRSRKRRVGVAKLTPSRSQTSSRSLSESIVRAIFSRFGLARGELAA
jgi:hypothetical protein